MGFVQKILLEKFFSSVSKDGLLKEKRLCLRRKNNRKKRPNCSKDQNSRKHYSLKITVLLIMFLQQ